MWMFVLQNNLDHPAIRQLILPKQFPISIISVTTPKSVVQRVAISPFYYSTPMHPTRLQDANPLTIIPNNRSRHKLKQGEF